MNDTILVTNNWPSTLGGTNEAIFMGGIYVTNTIILTNNITWFGYKPRTVEIYFKGKDITNIAAFSSAALLVILFLLTIFINLNKRSE